MPGSSPRMMACADNYPDSLPPRVRVDRGARAATCHRCALRHKGVAPAGSPAPSDCKTCALRGGDRMALRSWAVARRWNGRRVGQECGDDFVVQQGSHQERGHAKAHNTLTNAPHAPHHRLNQKPIADGATGFYPRLCGGEVPGRRNTRARGEPSWSPYACENGPRRTTTSRRRKHRSGSGGSCKHQSKPERG
jgi:hypothetical protein